MPNMPTTFKKASGTFRCAAGPLQDRIHVDLESPRPLTQQKWQATLALRACQTFAAKHHTDPKIVTAKLLSIAYE